MHCFRSYAVIVDKPIIDLCRNSTKIKYYLCVRLLCLLVHNTQRHKLFIWPIVHAVAESCRQLHPRTVKRQRKRRQNHIHKYGSGLSLCDAVGCPLTEATAVSNLRIIIGLYTYM